MHFFHEWNFSDIPKNYDFLVDNFCEWLIIYIFIVVFQKIIKITFKFDQFYSKKKKKWLGLRYSCFLIQVERQIEKIIFVSKITFCYCKPRIITILSNINSDQGLPISISSMQTFKFIQYIQLSLNYFFILFLLLIIILIW